MGDRTPNTARFVFLPPGGTKGLHHPIVGELSLSYEAFELPSDPGPRVTRPPTTREPAE